MGEHFWPNTPSSTSSSFMAAFLIYKYICSLYLSNRYLKLDRACAASIFSCPLRIYRYVFIFLWLQNINLTPPICLSIFSSSSSSSPPHVPCCFSHGHSLTKGPKVHDGMSRWAPNPVPEEAAQPAAVGNRSS